MHKELRSVDKQGLVFVLRLLQHYNAGGYGYAEEQIRRQLNHRINVVVVHKILAYLLFLATAIKHAGELYYRSRSLGREPRKHVHGKSKVTFAFGCEYTGRGISGVVNQQRIVIAYPLCGVGRIGDYGIEWFIIPMVGFEKRVAVVYVEVGIVDVVQKHVDSAQVVGSDVQFLTEEAFFDVVFAEHLGKLQ